MPPKTCYTTHFQQITLDLFDFLRNFAPHYKTIDK